MSLDKLNRVCIYNTKNVFNIQKYCIYKKTIFINYYIYIKFRVIIYSLKKKKFYNINLK